MALLILLGLLVSMIFLFFAHFKQLKKRDRVLETQEAKLEEEEQDCSDV